ncbi:MAG: phosphotransferase [Lachnospiraceae bacterium]|nr:phosphotransferase [Lachnospiraceae bacterium]
MFKIGGYRIEPGEIAGAIRKVCDLQHFVVRGFVYKDISSIIVFYTDDLEVDPVKMREHIRIFAKALKELHAIRAENSSFPNIKEVSVSLTGQLDPGFCSEDEADKIRAVFECIPDTDCFVHGDCHTGNAILLEGKISFIDMLLCGKGHPVFDLLGMYSHYVFLPAFISDEQCRQQLGLDKTHAENLFELFIGEYYPSVTDKERSELIGQIMGVHAARICLASVILPGAFPADVLSEAKKRAVAFSGRYCNDDRKNRLFSGVS